MGCIECAKVQKTDLEESISSLINSLLIKKISNDQYLKSIKKAYFRNNPMNLKTKFKEFLKPTEINYKVFSEDLFIFVDKLNPDESIIFSFALIFLTKQKSNFSIERNYYEMKEIFKRRIENYNDFELMNVIVRSYGQFITVKMLQIYLNSRSQGSKNEDIIYIQKCYTVNNLDEYLNKFFVKMSKDFQTETFFNENLKILQHEILSENLKIFYQDNIAKRIDMIKEKQLKEIKETNNEYELDKVEKKEKEEEEKEIRIKSENFINNSSILNKQNSSENISPEKLNLNDIDNNLRHSISSNIQNNINYSITSYIPLTTKLIKRYSNLKDSEENTINLLSQKALQLHNKFRNNHSANNLIINRDLQKFSQNWAEVLASNEKMANSTLIWKGNIIGESISEGDSNYFNLEDILTNWYEKKKNFNFDINSPQTNTNEFTQMIWKDTNEIGVGFAQSLNGRFAFVVNYFPAGNIRFEFKENVLP